MSDDIAQRLRAAVPKMPDSGTPIAWPCKVRSEFLLEAAAEIERLRADRRERIATAALQGLLANSYKNSPSWEIVVAATVYADLLIAKLDEEPQS